jgi:multidrug resistance protein, MATE family
MTAGAAAARLAVDARRLYRLAWPVLVGQLAVIGFSTVDTVLVARHARQDLAALSIGAAAYVTVFVGLMGVVLALGPIVGQLYGAGRLAQAGRQLHQAVWIALALALLGCALLVFPTPFLAIAQASPEVEAKARSYLLALAVALPGALLMQAYRGFNNAVSRPKAVMALQVAGLGLKLPLSAALVFGLPAVGIPPLGVVGCGIATAIVMWLQALVAWQVLRRDRFYARFELFGRGLDAPDRPALATQLRIGVPMGMTILIEVSGFTLMAIYIARLGVLPVAGHQIAANLAAILFMLPVAIGQAGLTLVAQRIGARDLADAVRLGWHAVLIGLMVALVVASALMVGRGAVARLYTGDAAVLAVAAPLLGWLALFHAVDAVQAVASFVLRAWRVTLLPMWIYAVSAWGIGLGGGYVLAFDPFGGVPAGWRGQTGYWMAATAGLALSALALTWLLAAVSRRQWPAAAPPATGAATG